MKPEDLQANAQSNNPTDLSQINANDPEMKNQPAATSQAPIVETANSLVTSADDETIQPITPGLLNAQSISPVAPEIVGNIYPNAPNLNQSGFSQNQSIFVDNNTTKKIKKSLIISWIIAGFVVIIGGGYVAAYVFLYSKSEKVITDAIVNMVTAKDSIYTGNIKVNNDNMDVSIDITSKQVSAKSDLSAKLSVKTGGNTYSANGNAIVDGTGDVYFKANVNELADDVKTYLNNASMGDANLQTSISKSVDNLVAKISDKWIKISSSDIAEFNKDYSKAKDCVNDTIKKYKDDNVAIAEITNLYGKQPFITVDKELGQKDGSIGYQIKSDNVKFKAFVVGLKDTKIYKSISSCDSSYSVDDLADSISDKTTSSSDDAKLELWVDAWSHQVTKIALNGKDSDMNVSAKILPKYDQKVDVITPSDSISLKQLMTYYEEAITSLYGSVSN